MKLVKTNLLLKHNHDSAIGVATATHLDFCKWQVRCFKSEIKGLFEEFTQSFVMFICLLVVVLFTPVLMLTNGLILYPYWIVLHLVKVKRIAKRFGVDYLNKSAEKLVKEIQEEE